MVPTEKDDLVEHLKYWAFKFCGRGYKEDVASDVMTEAWEEIERLREALKVREETEQKKTLQDEFAMAVDAPAEAEITSLIRKAYGNG